MSLFESVRKIKLTTGVINKFIIIYMFIGGILDGVLGYFFEKFILKF